MLGAELVMFKNVLGMAYSDLFGNVPKMGGGVSVDYRLEALHFFTDKSGGWAESRAALCQIVDRDPDKLRARIIAILESDVEEIQAYDTIRPFKNVALARALWHETLEKERQAAITRRERADKAQERREYDALVKQEEAAAIARADARHLALASQ